MSVAFGSQIKNAGITLFQSPSRFFRQEDQDHWPGTVVLSLFVLLWLLDSLLEIAGQALARVFSNGSDTWGNALMSAWHQWWVPERFQIGLLSFLIVFLFLWGTSKVVRAGLNREQVLILCLFYPLPPQIAFHLIGPAGVLLIDDPAGMLGFQALLLAATLLWSLTLLTLGVQAYSQAHWFRSLLAVLPVALLVFMQNAAEFARLVSALIRHMVPAGSGG